MLRSVEDLAALVAMATARADETRMTLVPAAPLRDCGPEVSFDPDKLDLSAFLSLAAKLGGGVLYCSADPFEPDDDDDPVELPPHLSRYKGQVGLVTLAFAANGLVHFWDSRTTWWQEVESLKDARARQAYAFRGGGVDEASDERPDPETRARMAAEHAAKLLAIPEFRAAKSGARQRVGRMALPEDVHSWVTWDAVRQACDQAEAMSGAQYAELTTRLDDLAAQLLTDVDFQRASSPGARKQAAEQFLISQADGFSPPAHVRDELYARAQKLSRAKSSPALF
jgi:hypothetical protein